LVAAIGREFEVRRSMRELEGLDDRVLRDIGLTRGEIQRAAWCGLD
jgi:uncharacterized protein YjiS (DUF1127 family)